MRKSIVAVAAAGLLASCGGGGEHQQNNSVTERKAASLQPGEYELSATVQELKSTDDTSPATSLQQGASVNSRACVAPDGKLDTAMLAEGKDSCTYTEDYIRNGRMSIQLRCTRAGKGGHVMQLADGTFKTDSFDARVLTSTAFSGPGDYTMTRQITGKRVGDCPAAE